MKRSKTQVLELDLRTSEIRRLKHTTTLNRRLTTSRHVRADTRVQEYVDADDQSEGEED